MTSSLPAPIGVDVDRALAAWDAADGTRRLWARDSSLWTGADEAKWLGWLDGVADQTANIAQLRAVAADIAGAGFTHALLLGMGGSSLCPEVFRLSFGRIPGAPDFHVLDSTDPGRIRAVESSIDLTRTIVIVASKSGSTLEPNILLEYFYDRVSRIAGEGVAGSRFIAITDPGSSLERVAAARAFRHVIHGLSSIGGRYSALSAFGMVPAAIMGLDIERLLERAGRMVRACEPGSPAAANPGVLLGVTLGVLARHGRDKLTTVTSPAIFDFGAWLEQLIGESTGKLGKGIVPVDLEPVGPPERYGLDRAFVYLRLESAPDAAQDASVAALEKAGHAVVRIPVADVYDLGQELFRWEIATAVAGSLLGINPFDQPDVEASKIATRRLTDEYEAVGSLPAETPILADEGITFFADSRNAAALLRPDGTDRSAASILKAHFARATTGDYAALLAYVPMNAEHLASLQAIRQVLRDRLGIATCVGFGPRFLHSTGQMYKGGPNTGVFLQITCDDRADLPVPGRKYTFGVVKAAQARGDFQVLADRGRRALRVHIGADVEAGLQALQRIIAAAIG